MGTKTYCSASMSNLNSSSPEFRWERLAILETSTAHWQHIMRGLYLQETQLGGHGTSFRNWIYWARKYKFSGYHNVPELAKYDKTYNELIQFIEPQVQASVSLDENQMQGFLENTLNLPSGSQTSEDGSITVTGVMPDGSLKEVTITGRYRVTYFNKTIDSYSGAYDSSILGEAYVWQHYDQYLADSDYIKRYILNNGDITAYQVIPGDNLSEAGDSDDDYTHVDGDQDDCWLQLGYSFTEPHVDEDTNENVDVDVFNSEENIYIALQSLISKYSMYFAIWGYIYNKIELDSNQYVLDNNGYLKLNNSGNPTKNELLPDIEGNLPEPEWKAVKVPFKISYEDWEKTVTEEYETDINLASVQGFGYIQDLTTAANNPYLGSSINTDISNLESLMPPIVCFRHDKRWIDENFWGGDWWLVNTYACKKVSQDKNYYPDLFESLRKQITQGDVAWVYLIYGLPCNYAQTHYGAHYALQFFKQLTIPNWQQYTHGSVGSASGKGKAYTFKARQFNLTFRFSVGNTYYQCGKGMCPVAGYSDVRPGEAGVKEYNGGTTFWNQCQSDSWECITVYGYSNTFTNIKNGVGASAGGANWYLPIWKEENVERQYSKCILPMMWQVGKNIPYTDWTNLYQFCANVGATAYKVVKTKWYQSGLFKIILTIVIIVISVIVMIYCPPAGGMLASMGASIAASVGGSTLFWTAVVTVAASVAVSVVVNALITPILKDAFGPVVGSILGALVSIAAMSYLSGSFNVVGLLDQFMNPMTWLAIGNAGINAKQEILQQKMKELQSQMQEWNQMVEERHDEINSLYADVLGGKGSNPYLLNLRRHYGATNANATETNTVETGEQMINRCITGVINAIPNSIYVLEEYSPLSIENNTIPSIMFGGNRSSNALS